MEWFYEKNGQQAGPISEAQLKGLFAASEINATTLIWKQGMADWSPLVEVMPDLVPGGQAPQGLSLAKVSCPTCGASVLPGELIPAGADTKLCPNCRDQYAQSLKEGVSPTAGFEQKRGTGGMTPISELRAIARGSLAGNWTNGVLITLLSSVISNGLSYIPLAGPLIQWVIAGPIALGYQGFFLKVIREERAEVGDLFSGFSSFGRAFGIYFVVAIIVGLVAALAAIPGGILMILAATGSSGEVVGEDPMFVLGLFVSMVPAVIVAIYFSLKYALVYFIAHEHDEIGVMKVLERSGQMMQGRKLKLVGLFITFIGWHILGLLALVIGLLWSYTYMMTAFAAFYDDIGEDV
ncbi:DUF975 family protein [Coraliomargarita akajimensis]|uniref:GYF domain-containing protein n=1 Tax=Coraliomargarita akajimensis (strain DSM 45221 / IAM 15411 / JCM 23193 / KCTC 12865 / 04OKA010-24) TaxID=583355 RepID=D5EII6_CORAD|nr:DUF975 family protein [Coraliomargarita akajimensis]ADE54252.1 protein of unknown function DUF975 [Coraliomargarita akajimensis DSM 45221]